MSDLLADVQRALCCPKGCRALAEGDLEACGAKLTKEHAQAAIDVVQRAYRDKIRALIDLRSGAGKLADRGAVTDDEIRALAKIASDALA